MKVKDENIIILLLRKEIQRGGIHLPLPLAGLKNVEPVSTLSKFFQIHSVKTFKLTMR